MPRRGRAYALAQCAGMLVLVCYAWTVRRPVGIRLVCAWRGGWPAACHVDVFGVAVPLALLLYCLWQWRSARAGHRVLTALLIGMASAVPYYVFRLWHLLEAGEVARVPPLPTRPVLLAERLVQISPFGFGLENIPAGCAPALVIWGCAGLIVLILASARGAVGSADAGATLRRLFWLLFLVPLGGSVLTALLTGSGHRR